MIKIYEVRIIKDDRTCFHQCFFDEKLAEFEANQQNERAIKEKDTAFFFVKPMTKSYEFYSFDKSLNEAKTIATYTARAVALARAKELNDALKPKERRYKGYYIKEV